MQIWNRHYFNISQELPPEKLFDGEVGKALEVDSFDNVVIFGDSLDSAPEVPPFESVLWAEGLDGGLEVSTLLDWKGLTDSVDELELGVEVDDIHLYRVWEVVMYDNNWIVISFKFIFLWLKSKL